MNPSLEVIAGQLSWANANINHNLDFVPDDKLDWKPAPTAKSVLEIINHAAQTVNFFSSVVSKTEAPQLTPATNREEAKALVTQVVEAHKAVLGKLQPSDLEGDIELPFGKMPAMVVVGVPVVELVNHHGQITYIQTVLGDAESHMLFQ